jgi:RNA polymerase sigma-32 factor
VGDKKEKEMDMAGFSLTLSPEQGLSRYLSEIRKFPLLEKNEEFMLAQRWAQNQDAEAAERMVTSHLRLVAKIAMGYRGYGLPIGEVISEGNVGLMQAVKKFDPTRASAWPPTRCGGSAPRSRNTSCARGRW